MKNNTTYIKLAAILGALTVVIGAFGAHGLEPVLTRYDHLDTYETAVKYQFYHTLAILLLGVLMRTFQEEKYLKYSVLCFFTGIIIFSGSLYVLSLTNLSWLGAITPLGGLAFILGWIFLFIGVWKK